MLSERLKQTLEMDSRSYESILDVSAQAAITVHERRALINFTTCNDMFGIGQRHFVTFWIKHDAKEWDVDISKIRLKPGSKIEAEDGEVFKAVYPSHMELENVLENLMDPARGELVGTCLMILNRNVDTLNSYL